MSAASIGRIRTADETWGIASRYRVPQGARNRDIGRRGQRYYRGELVHTPARSEAPRGRPPRRRAARVTRRVVERRPGKGDQAILPSTSEPPLGPLDHARSVSPDATFVLEAFEEHQQKLTSFAYAMTRDRDAADDLVQESFLRLVKELNAGRQPDNVAAWLFRVCSNLAMSRGRRIGTVQKFIRVARGRTDAPPADIEILRREENAALLEGLARLAPDARAALLMAAQGFSGREIAEALGRTEVATRTMMFRAREKLRVYLVHEGVRG
jgi:RNA polymerase sigma-70 factor (ECF subfamily)